MLAIPVLNMVGKDPLPLKLSQMPGRALVFSNIKVSVVADRKFATKMFPGAVFPDTRRGLRPPSAALTIRDDPVLIDAVIVFFQSIFVQKILRSF